jgi:hypothetical protein
MKSDRTDPSPLSQWKKWRRNWLDVPCQSLPPEKFKKTALFILVPSAFD